MCGRAGGREGVTVGLESGQPHKQVKALGAANRDSRSVWLEHGQQEGGETIRLDSSLRKV